MTHASTPALRACLISLTNCSSEPRLLRQIWTLRKRGWSVTVVGYPGTNPIPEEWDFLDVTPPAPAGPGGATDRQPADAKASLPKALIARAARRLRRAFAPSADATDSSRLTPIDSIDSALEHYWASGIHAYVRDQVLPRVPRSNLVIAHDYYTFPLADVVAGRDDCPTVADIHEYATEQYRFTPGSPQEHYWLTRQRPMIREMQAHFFPRFAGLTTVSAGISRALHSDYGLPTGPVVVRSVPWFEAHPFRPSGSEIVVLYHGLINEMRHLHVLVESLPLWASDRKLVLRGPADPAYRARLLAQAVDLKVAGKLSIEEAVPFRSLIRRAAEADVGCLVFENYSAQREFTSPNKFFEYMMAGLAVLTMETTDLAPIVREHDVGVFAETFTPAAIAQAVNGLNRGAIDNFKRNSLRAAEVLCWENEQTRMIAAYGLDALEGR